jgi:antirestriction protein
MTARVYVGTYAKYNSGSIAGAWLDLEDYGDAESFASACRALHADESDPELMYQDYEGFPRVFYGECSIDPAVWDWLALDDGDRELLAVYQDGVDGEADFETARDRYMGRFDSEADWAADFIDDCGMLADMPENLRCYFDYEAYARDARLGGDVVFVRHDGDVWVFSGN